MEKIESKKINFSVIELKDRETKTSAFTDEGKIVIIKDKRFIPKAVRKFFK